MTLKITEDLWESEYEIIREETYDDIKYRILLYDNSVYVLQSKSENEDYENWLISPHPKRVETPLDEDDSFIEGTVFPSTRGYTDLSSVLDCVRDSVRLQNGDYWELNVYLQQEGEEVKQITEIITQENGLDLISKIENLAELMKEAELYQVDNEIDIVNYLFRIICFAIIVSCLIIVILNLLRVI